jgi:eukaryotic-like serine/threonine-protein kinase
LSTSAKNNDPAEIAGRYQVMQRLGAGAFGTVYKAKDKILGRVLAIKTIRLEGMAAQGASLDELLDRFKREAQVSAQLKHANIVTIYDIGDADGLSYLAMEFIDGIGLERVIANEGRVSVERAAMLCAQVADALDFAHRNHVVHRDVKPANIMIETGDRVKVTDFGIAKVMDSGDHLTMTGSLLGTPSYMSPEQARGSVLDGRSDLFAVGAILYELLTGQKAFRGDSITGLIFKIITEEPQAIEELLQDTPPEVSRIVKKALAKAPEIRYQTGRELADDLLTLTRAGSAPTMRQSDVDTARGSSASPTVVGVPPSLDSAQTAGGDAPTRVAPPPPPRVPAPAPTTLIPPAPAPAGPTTLLPPPPPPRAPQAPAARPAMSLPPAPRPVAAQGGSKTGLILGIVGGGGLLALAAVAALVYFLVIKPRQQGPEVPPSTLVAETPSTTTPQSTLAPTEDTLPPATQPAEAPPATSPTTSPSAPPTTQRQVADVDRTPPVTNPPVPSLPPADGGWAVLNREPAGVDLEGSTTSGDVADAYRSSQGQRSSGTGTRLRARPKIPAGIGGPERRAAINLVHMIRMQEAYKRSSGRYGSFKDTLPAGINLASGNVVQNAIYRFQLTVESDGFKIVATPTSASGLRPLQGDDSGFVTYADE